MNLQLRRLQLLPDCTKGGLYAEGHLQCFTLELPRRLDGKLNIENHTCILEGAYVLVQWASVHVGHVVPLLCGVPGRTVIEIHEGNTPSDSLGCILVGNQWAAGAFVGQSDAAFAGLMAAIGPAWNNGDTVTLEVTDSYVTDDTRTSDAPPT